MTVCIRSPGPSRTWAQLRLIISNLSNRAKSSWTSVKVSARSQIIRRRRSEKRIKHTWLYRVSKWSSLRIRPTIQEDKSLRSSSLTRIVRSRSWKVSRRTSRLSSLPHQSSLLVMRRWTKWATWTTLKAPILNKTSLLACSMKSQTEALPTRTTNNWLIT